MEKKMNLEDITKVSVAYGTEVANELLSEGYVLLDFSVHKLARPEYNKHGQFECVVETTETIYLLGKLKE